MTLRTVAVDFDGVVHSYTQGWTGYKPLDDPEPGALGFILGLQAQGYEVVIMSARAHNEEGVKETENWLESHGFPQLRVTNEKVTAVAYVDDRAVPHTTGSGDWQEVSNRIGHLAGVASTQDRYTDT